MINFVHVLGIAVLLLYLGACLALWIERRSGRGYRSELLLVVGVALHTVCNGLLLIEGVLTQLDRGSHYLMLISWVLALACLWWRRRRDDGVLGQALLVAVIVLLVAASVLAHGEVAEPRAMQSLLFVGFHVLPAVLAESCLILACLVSLIALRQEMRIKRKQVDPILLAGPNLRALDRFSAGVAVLGLVGISVALLTGIAWSLAAAQPVLSADLRKLSAFVLWLVLSLIVMLRWRGDLSAYRLSRITVMSSCVFLLTLLISFLVQGQVWHGFE